MGRRYSKGREPVVEELAAVGLDADIRLLWLGDFARRELLDASERERAAAELTSFVVLQFVGTKGGGFVELDVDRYPNATDVPALQAVVSSLLAGLVPGSSAWFEPPAFPQPIAIGNGLIWREGRGVMLATRQYGHGWDGLVAIIVASVVDLLLAIGPRLRRCRGCQRLFALARPHQRFCDTTCANASRVAAWRKRNPKRASEQRHQQYVRKVKARQPRAKVTRRRQKEKKA
jgi:hypothetical protein